MTVSLSKPSHLHLPDACVHHHGIVFGSLLTLSLDCVLTFVLLLYGQGASLDSFCLGNLLWLWLTDYLNLVWLDWVVQGSLWNSMVFIDTCCSWWAAPILSFANSVEIIYFLLLGLSDSSSSCQGKDFLFHSFSWLMQVWAWIMSFCVCSRSCWDIQAWLRCEPGSPVILWVPYFHIFGLARLPWGQQYLGQLGQVLVTRTWLLTSLQGLPTSYRAISECQHVNPEVLQQLFAQDRCQLG